MTAPPRSSAETAPVHAPKVERFDVAAMTNTDPKGVVRAVREYRVEPFGLFLARDVVDHPRLAAFESWLLPGLGLRVTDWFFHPGHERDQDFYLDVVRIDVGAAGLLWRTEDHYLDLLVHTGRGVQVVDTDELLEAVTAGLLDTGTARSALDTTYATVDGLARHGYRLDRWLATADAWPTWTRHSGGGDATAT
jgi:predicted RNA-binding protein associated with RNAse of E/G family